MELRSPTTRDRIRRTIEQSGVREGTVYIQITRGVAPRKHAFPAGDVKPTVYVAAKPFKNHPETYFTKGVGAITVPDTRWTRCDIKSISLLPNVLANNAAHEADAFEALFVKDGVVIEGSHSNLFGVLDGTLITYPSCNYILSGISREVVLQLARELGNALRGRPCVVLSSDARVHVPETSLYTYPDVTVLCGQARTAPSDRHALFLAA